VVDRQLRVGLFCHRRGDRLGRRARCVDEVVEQVHHVAGSFNVREVPNAGEHLEPTALMCSVSFWVGRDFYILVYRAMAKLWRP
jgi:hypothetical protein